MTSTKKIFWALLSETTCSIHLFLVENIVKLTQSSLLFPILWVRTTDSFLPYQIVYSHLTAVCQASVEVPGGTSRGWKKSIPKGSCSLLMSISQHPNITPHCDDTDSLRDMYLQCLAMLDFSITSKKYRKKKGKRKTRNKRKKRVPTSS